MSDFNSELSGLREKLRRNIKPPSKEKKKNEEHMLYLDLKKYEGQRYMS